MKKIIAIILTMCVLVLPITLSAHWATESIEYAIQNEFIAADNVLLTQLDTPILRGAVVELVSNAMPEHLDIADIVLGDGYGDLMLERTITREEFFTVIGRAFSLSSENFTSLNAFTDVDDISEYAKPFISGLVQESLVFGYPNGEFMPQGDITTAEVIAMLERVHRFAEENTTTDEPTQQSPTPGIISDNGGGSFRPRPPVTPPIEPDPPISPEVHITFSEDDWTWESVTVTIDVTSNEEIVNVRWVRADSGVSTSSGIARIPYNFDYRLLFLFDMGVVFDPEVEAMFEEYMEELGEYADIGVIWNFIENSFRGVGVDPSCGGWFEWAEHPENFTDFSEPLVGNEINFQQNGTFYIFAEDVEGNITIKEVFVGNIRTAQVDLDVVRHDPPVNGAVATVSIANLEENPNAPVVAMWLIPRRIPMFGGGFRDMNVFFSTFVETAQDNGTIAAETNGEFSITELDMENTAPQQGVFTLVMLDAWGNYSYSTIII